MEETGTAGVPTTEELDLSDLPVYDEEYTPARRHRLSLTMFVRNLEDLTDDMYNEHLAKLTLMIPEHEHEFNEHTRIKHDAVDCPAEDVDPFEQNYAISYAKALTQEVMEEEDEEDLMRDLYNIGNISGLDNSSEGEL